MEIRTYLRVLFRYWWLVLIALVVTVGFTAWFTFRQTPLYEASASFIVRPTLSDVDQKSELSGLDVLGRQGDIASTFAEMANSRQTKIKVADSLGLSASQRGKVSVDSQIVSGTYLLKITVESPDPELTRDFANMVGAETIRFVEDLYVTYELVPLDAATAPSSPSKPNKMLNLVLSAALGLVLGAGLAFLAYYLRIPAEAVIAPAVPAGVTASQPEAEVIAGSQPIAEPVAIAATTAATAAASEAMESGKGAEEPAEPSGILPVPRRIVGWIAAAVLTVALVVGALIILLSDRGTSSAAVPPETTLTSLAAAAALTTTAMSQPENTDMPTIVPSLTATTEPSATTSPKPSATPIVIPSVTPTTEPSATSSPEPSATATEEPTATETVEPTATATTAPSETPTDMPTPTAEPTEPSAPAATPEPAGTLLPAPKLLAPLDRQDFQPNAEIVLRWEWTGELPEDAYYEVTVAYSHLGERWFDDVPWLRELRWTLTDHTYLPGLSDDGQYWWSVQVVGQTGTDADGNPVGEPLSAPSQEWLVTWRKTSGGGPRDTPTPPDP